MTGSESNDNISHKLKLPCDAYEGSEPYIFISYKHADSDMVYPVIKELHNRGFNIWYDHGLPYGDNYDIEIAKHIKNCALFVNCITRTAMECANDQEDYLIKEFGIARKFKKPILPLYLEDVELDGYYLVHLLDRQAIFKFEYEGHEERFFNECVKAFVERFALKQNDTQVKSGQEKQWQSVIVKYGLTSEQLKEFDKLNTTTESIFNLEGHNVLIILKDGTNLTDWQSVTNRKRVLYVSEDLSGIDDLSGRYRDLKSLKAIVALNVSDKATKMQSMFDGCSSLVDITTLKDWDVSNVDDMSFMFRGCRKLSNLSSLSEWNTGNVETMESTFEGCIKLRDLHPLKDWNFSKVSTMKGMFCDCRLEELFASKNWDMSNVVDMAEMFRGCGALLDLAALRDWDVSNVENMHSMFEGCYNLDNLYGLRNWDVGNVTVMDSIFKNCERLDNLSALKDWDVSNVETMEGMFGSCFDLDDLYYLKDWNVGNVTNMNGLFSTCKYLVDLSPLKNWDVSNVTNMESMFYGCFNLVDISALKNWDVSNVESMWTMFSYCGALDDLSALKDWDVTSVENMWAMFSFCNSLRDLSVLDGWDVRNVDLIDAIFEGCKSIETYPKWDRWGMEKPDSRLTGKNLRKFDRLNDTTESIFDLEDNEVLIILNDWTNLTSWDDVEDVNEIMYVSEDLCDCEDLSRRYEGLDSLKAVVAMGVSDKATTIESMFDGCCSLVDMAGPQDWDISNVTNMGAMFKGCSSLEDLSPLEDWDVSNVECMASMFDDCCSLVDLSSLDEWNVSDKTDIDGIFNECNAVETYPKWFSD